MSVSDRGLLEHATRTATDRADCTASVQRLASALTGSVESAVRAVAFWLATLLPLSYLPLLATGVTAEHPLGFVALLASNVLGFVVGHTHEPGAN